MTPQTALPRLDRGKLHARCIHEDGRARPLVLDNPLDLAPYVDVAIIFVLREGRVEFPVGVEHERLEAFVECLGRQQVLEPIKALAQFVGHVLTVEMQTHADLAPAGSPEAARSQSVCDLLQDEDKSFLGEFPDAVRQSPLRPFCGWAIQHGKRRQAPCCPCEHLLDLFVRFWVPAQRTGLTSELGDVRARRERRRFQRGIESIDSEQPRVIVVTDKQILDKIQSLIWLRE